MLLFELFIGLGVRDIYEKFSDFIKLWDWPGRIHGSQLHEIFSASRQDKHRAAKHIKCQASDLLSLMGVLAMFVQQILLPLAIGNAACHAYLALADVVDFIVSIAKVKLAPAKLDTAVERFLDLFVAAFGLEWLTPKFHWLLRFGDALARFSVLLNCFVLERKHRVAKRYATELKNISRAASSSMIMEVTSHHLAVIQAPKAFDYAVGPVGGRPAPKSVVSLLKTVLEFGDDAEVITAMEARYSAVGTCMRNDAVLIKDGSSYRAGQVLLHASYNGVAVSLVSVWRLHSINRAAGYAKWHADDDSKMLIETADILDSVCHTKIRRGNVVTTLLPPELR